MLYALGVAFLWGSQPILHKMLLKDLNFITIMLFSEVALVVCSVVFMLCVPRHLKGFVDDVRHHLNLRCFMLIALVSVGTIFLSTILYYTILKDHTTSVVTSIIYTAPVFTLLLSQVLLKEKMNASGLLGIALIVGGVVTLFLDNALA
jgi:drug/metabolite transporter (DMT)-like permease